MASKISPLVIANLTRWISHGIPPGHFLMAVLCNDLREAVVRADDVNVAALPDIVHWVRNHAPTACWGSPAAVNRWKLSRRREVRSQEIRG